MKLRETLLGLLVLAALAGGAWWARGRGRAKPAPSAASPPASAAGAATEASLPDVTLADASVDLGDVRLVLSTSRPVVAFSRALFRARAESNGVPVALEGGRLSFEMTMPMGDHRHALVPGADGWQEAEVFLPLCRSGGKTWLATLEGTVAGRPRSARFRVDVTPSADTPTPGPPAR